MSEALKIYDLVDNTVGHSQAEFDERSALPEKHFKFRINPFLDNVNPQFFFRTEAHEDAYIKMKKCIDENIAVGLTTALSGTGKTLLTQILLTELDEAKYEPVLVLAYPGLTRTGLLRECAAEIGVGDLAPRAPMHLIMSAIQERIVDLHKNGRKLVIIIDECHFLGVEALQMVRTLSNLELPEKKLVTILLFGEDSLLKKINKPEYASIFNRMFVRARLRPLSESETRQYIKFRCLVSGGNANIFPDDFYAVIHEASGGIPREINRLCHTALLEAARRGTATVTPDLIGQ
ncbi:MAG: AAA family ATPase [Candidatus Sumerlaeaceae bacterium]|nr:AAA family ATPase [Candidatus Sumerlaeaceae bacterium]